MGKQKSKVVVITGSTRGIAFALAGAFIEKGCRVVVSGRNQQSVDGAIEVLMKKNRISSVVGIPCNVRKVDDLQVLWDFAMITFGCVDI